jgi:hypothetical protein
VRTFPAAGGDLGQELRRIAGGAEVSTWLIVIVSSSVSGRRSMSHRARFTLMKRPFRSVRAMPAALSSKAWRNRSSLSASAPNMVAWSMATEARWVKRSTRRRSRGLGWWTRSWYTAKVPVVWVRPPMGVDQHDRRPWGIAISRKPSHRGSVVMSAATTGMPR